MRQTGAGRPRFAAFLTSLSIVFVAGLAQGQAPPVGQVPEPPPVGGQPLPTGSLVKPATPQDPFAGSPLLKMFERPLDEPNPIRQLRLAPVPQDPIPFAVRLSLTAEEEFTDNANQSKDNRVSQFSTRLTPGISMRADRPWVNASLSYAPSVFIQNNTISDTELNQNLSLRAALWPTGKFQLNLSDDFIDSNNFQDIQNPGSRLTGSESFLQNTATAEAVYNFPRFRTALAYTNVINQEDQVTFNSQATFTDTRIAHIVRPSVVYADTRATVGGAYTLTRGDENSSLSIPYWSHQGDGYFRYALNPVITPGLAGGYQFQDPDVGRYFSLGRGRATLVFGVGRDGTLDLAAGADVFAQQGNLTTVRPSALASYTHRFSAFSVTGRYEQGYLNNSLSIDNSGVTFTRTAGVFLTTEYFRDLTTTFGLRYDENEYQQTTGTAIVGTRDWTWAVDLAFRYLLARSLFLTLGYTGFFRSSTEASAEFNENLVRLGLTYEYTRF